MFRPTAAIDDEEDDGTRSVLRRACRPSAIYRSGDETDIKNKTRHRARDAARPTATNAV